MRLLPKSLAGQMLLLIGAALFIAQAINFALLLGEVRARRATFTEGGAIARTIDTVERVQMGLPVAQQPRPTPDRLTVTVGQLAITATDRDTQLENRLKAALARAGYPALALRASRVDGEAGRDRLLIAVRLEDGRWVNLRSTLPPVEAGLIIRLLGQTVILLLSLLVAVFLIGRHVARPLRRLTDAAETFGSSGRREPVTPEGPSDVQRLMTTYNLMQSRILDMLTEKDRMLGAIGHDLRTPLASLRLRAETVDDDEERQRMISTIEEMDRTLEDILSLARLGRSTEVATRIDLAAFLDALAQDLQDLGWAVSFQPAERVVATARPRLLRRAVRNLVENAVKYGVEARITLTADGPDAIITIDDRGPGIPDEDLDRVMEGFVRLDDSRNRATGGTGLGLTIARSIVQEQGGALSLENLPQGGLSARIRLPLDR